MSKTAYSLVQASNLHALMCCS